MMSLSRIRLASLHDKVMSAEQAARAVLALRPKNVYPYHYRTQGIDPNETIATFKALVAVDAKINVVLLKWY